MAEKPKIVGYGICGPNEKRLEATFKEFARLCDETIILFNNAPLEYVELAKKYGFHTAQDNTEWGRWQWNIKEKFITRLIPQLKPDLLVALDMDEVFDKNLTKEKLYDLYKTEFPAFYFYIVNLWDDGYNPDRNFWNIRVWKWREDLGTAFPRKNVHCGLAPEWVWARGMYVPYILKHYGLKDKEDRERKVERYKKYDPEAKCIIKEYYQSLESNPQVMPFDEDKLHQDVVDYVHKYKQSFVEPMNQKEDLIIIKTLAGEEAVVPKKQQAIYEKQGCEIVGDYKAVEQTLNEILDAKEETKDEEIEIVNEEPTQEVFICSDCQKQFPSGRALNAHKIGAHKKSYKWGK